MTCEAEVYGETENFISVPRGAPFGTGAFTTSIVGLLLKNDSIRI